MTLKIYLTQNIEKLTSLKQEVDRCHGVEIHLADTKDYFKFVNFIMGGSYDRLAYAQQIQ